LYNIKEAAKLAGLSASTIRYYDKQGLLPFLGRTEAGYRVFSEQDMGLLKMIEYMKATGMSIQEIRQFTDCLKQGDASLQTRYEMFLQRKAVVQEQIRHMQETLAVIEYKCWYYRTAVEAGTEAIHKN